MSHPLGCALAQKLREAGCFVHQAAAHSEMSSQILINFVVFILTSVVADPCQLSSISLVASERIGVLTFSSS